MMSCNACVMYLNADLLVDTVLLFFDLLFKLFERCCIRGSAVCFQHLNISAIYVNMAEFNNLSRHSLIRQGCNLLLFDLIVNELLAVLFPVFSRRGWGHCEISEVF